MIMEKKVLIVINLKEICIITIITIFGDRSLLSLFTRMESEIECKCEYECEWELEIGMGDGLFEHVKYNTHTV